jgi:hypothetical protein
MQVSELARTHNSFGHFVAEQVRNPASESQQCVGIHVDADFRRLAEKLTSLPDRLAIYQSVAALQSCGNGKHACMSLTMRRSPRVNQEVLLRATFLG